MLCRWAENRSYDPSHNTIALIQRTGARDPGRVKPQVFVGLFLFIFIEPGTPVP